MIYLLFNFGICMAINPENSLLFFQKPEAVYADTYYRVPPYPYSTFEKLENSLQENGPLVAVGRMGPNFYTGEPFELRDKVDGYSVFGWKPNTTKATSDCADVILLGTRKVQSKEYIYYTQATEFSGSETIKVFGPSKDGRIFVMTYENFLNRALFDLHPVVPDATWLYNIETSFLIDQGETEKKCKKVGQGIFDHYKGLKSSELAQDALVRICDAAKILGSGRDGTLRARYIEKAWDGVGDTEVRWNG